MSDSDELISSDQDLEFVSDDSYIKDGGLPSGELVVEEFEDGSEEIIRKRNNNEFKKRRAFIPSESEEQDEEFDSQALSPHIRMSITGITPSDVSDSSEIEYSDAKSEIAGKIKKKGLNVEHSTLIDKNIWPGSQKSENSFLHRSTSEQNTEKSSVGEIEKNLAMCMKAYKREQGLLKLQIQLLFIWILLIDITLTGFLSVQIRP